VRRLRIVVVQLLFGFCLLEVGLRLYQPLPFRVHGSRIVLPVHHSYRFETDAPGKLDHVARHTKNSLGFRGPDPPADLSSRPSIVTIGGSTTECLFLSDGQTWTDIMARRLESRWPRLWVNNAGLDGQSTYGHVVLLRDYIVGLRPSVALFLIGINDVQRDDPTTYDAALAPGGSFPRRALRALVDRSETLSLVRNLTRAAHARQLGFGHSAVDVRQLRELKLDPDVVAAELAQHDRYLPGYENRLARIIALCREHGIEPVFITQPALYGMAVDPSTGVDLATRQFTGRGNGEVEWRVLERYNDVTRHVAERAHVPLVDLARLLPKDSRFFYDHIHYSIEGGTRVGEIVAAGIEPFLKTRFQPD